MSEANETFAGAALRALRAAGAEVVFGLPGVHNLAFWRVDDPTAARLVNVRHEQTTVYAADGWARRSGALGAALTTTGPGAANAVAAFGEAAASGSPVVLLATEVATSLRLSGRRGALHESRDQAGMFEPLAKAVFRPRRSEDCASALAEAIATALCFPRGPTYIDVPADLLAVPAPPIELAALEVPAAQPGDLAELARRLDEAERIVLWAGGGVVQSGAAGELRAVAERLAAPVVETFAGRGVMPAEHPLRIGAPPQEPAIRELIASAQAMLAVGTDFDGMMTRNWTMAVPPLLALIDVDPLRASRNIAPALAVRADARSALAGLLPLVRAREVWCKPGPAVRRAVLDGLRADTRCAAAIELLEVLADVLQDGTAVLADMCVAGYWTSGYATVRAPRTLQYPMGWGTLGYALPASIGAAATGSPCLVVAGDGGLLFAVGELATIAEQQLPVTVLVVDDSGYGMLRFDQDRAGDPRRGVDLASPDFVDLARAFGIEACEVAFEPAALRQAIGKALGAGAPRLLCTKAALFPPRTTSLRWNETTPDAPVARPGR